MCAGVLKSELYLACTVLQTLLPFNLEGGILQYRGCPCNTGTTCVVKSEVKLLPHLSLLIDLHELWIVLGQAPFFLIFLLVKTPKTISLILWTPRQNCGPGSSVGIATNYGLDCPGIESQWSEIFRPSRPSLRPTQPPVKWVPGLSRGKIQPWRAADHSPLLVPRSWKSRAIPLTTLRATTGSVTGTLYTLLPMILARPRDRQNYIRKS